MGTEQQMRKKQINAKAFRMSKAVASNVFHNDIFEGVDKLRRQLLRQDRTSVVLCSSRRAATKKTTCKTATVNYDDSDLNPQPTFEQLLRRPKAFVAMIPQPAALFLAGALAGTMAKTVSCPLDRVKMLLQVKGGATSGLIAEAAKSGNVVKTFLAVGKQEGLGGYFKGNIPQVIRAIPYDAVRLCAYEQFKNILRDDEGNLSVPARLLAGAFAGMTSTFVTYPLDTIRFRLAIDPTMKSMPQVVGTMLRQEGFLAFYKGLVPSLAGIAPYIAINYTTFDLMKKHMPADLQSSTSGSFIAAFLATTVATTFCYPLDTLRRQMQMKTVSYNNIFHAYSEMSKQGGPLAVYRGFVPNMLKNLPTNSIRLASFDAGKQLIIEGEEAYNELQLECTTQRQSTAC